MRSSERRIRLCSALLIMNLALIWGNSLLPGELSGAVSGFVTELLGKLFGMAPGESQGGHGLLRKLAHFSEFACFGALLAWRCAMKGETGKTLITQTLLGGLLTACVDETIQRYVPDRGSSLLDVWIDFSGVAAGLTILLLGHHYLVVQNHQNIMEETQ